jgi:hypothetical protein
LLPTPSAYESTPGDEFIEEVRENLDDPHKRLYLPGRKWHAQRTLSRMAPALLPTPSANDHTGAESEEARARRGRTTGSAAAGSLRDMAHLLPTPNRSDSFGMEDSEAIARGVRPSGQPIQVGLRNVKDLLPTPITSDSTGQTPEGDPKCGEQLREIRHLLRTPVANTDNPGTGGELRAQLTHGPTRRNETGVDTMGRPNTGRPSRGDHTNPQSSDGSPSSDDALPLQLTLGDASSHASSNG